MRLNNYTDIPDDVIRAIIREVKPSGIGNFDVRVSNGQRFRGRAYAYGSGYHDRACPFIIAAIPKVWRAQIIPARGAYLSMAIGSRMEALVVLLAHELRHIWQGGSTSKPRRRGMVYGARGRFSERDADAYALRMLRRYRRGELNLAELTA